MNIFCIADTHFDHDKLSEYDARPVDFTSRIISNCHKVLKEDDLLIHLGDFMMGKPEKWTAILSAIPGRKVLVKGNHDSKSYSWYMNNGFNFSCRDFGWRLFGIKILFSHRPRFEGEFDLNIHGHLHAGRHRDIKTDHRHYLISLEKNNYQPEKLDTIVEKWKKENDL